MIFGWGAKKAPEAGKKLQVSHVTPHTPSSPHNAGLRNALINFIKRDDQGKLLKLRLGSQARISHSNVQDIVNAFDDLMKTGEVNKSQVQQVIKSLVDLFESKELGQAIQVKIKEDTQRSAQNIREAGVVLAKLYPEPVDKSDSRYQQPEAKAVFASAA